MKTKSRLKRPSQCQICQKKPVMGYNHPHSVHRTKKIIKPNIQKVKGLFLCARCLRTQAKS